MMPVYVIIFEGGNCIEDPTQITLPSWTRESVVEAFKDYLGKGGRGVGDAASGNRLDESVDLVGDRIAQVAAHSENGGMVYMVRTSP